MLTPKAPLIFMTVPNLSVHAKSASPTFCGRTISGRFPAMDMRGFCPPRGGQTHQQARIVEWDLEAAQWTVLEVGE